MVYLPQCCEDRGDVAGAQAVVVVHVQLRRPKRRTAGLRGELGRAARGGRDERLSYQAIDTTAGEVAGVVRGRR